MPIEVPVYISDLNTAWPLGSDGKNTLDDHARNTKTALKNSFPNVTGAVTATHTTLNSVTPLTNGTAVASTSGTSIDFTGIPSWVKRITVNFASVSKSGTDMIYIQLGDSGGAETSGYLGTLFNEAGAVSNIPNGFYVGAGSNTTVWNGSLTLILLDASTNTWTGVGSFGASDVASVSQVFGSKALSATLDRVRVTVSGVNTFDAGKINIQYD